MSRTIECPICLGKADAADTLGDYETVSCPRCGHFKISGTAIAIAKGLGHAEREKMLRDAQGRVLKPGKLPLVIA